MIYYYRFCCRIKIADEPGEWGEPVAATEGDADTVRARYDDARVGPYSDWFAETPALTAHLRALSMGHSGDRRVDTAAACLYTGRTPAVLYRWAREGRITRYKRGHASLWDLFELPVKGGSAPPRK